MAENGIRSDYPLLPGNLMNINKSNDKKNIVKIIEGRLLSIVQSILNEDKAVNRVAELKNKYRGLPNDALANVLIKRATRKTTVEGGMAGTAISGLEAIVAAPAPEPSHKVLAVTGICSTILTDFSYTVSVQLQLIMDISELYGCRFDRNDEDDIWIILKAALGIKGIEKIGGWARTIIQETGRAQFRKFLRTGIRKAIQDKIIRISGRQIGRYLGERYVMRLIPIANIAIGAGFNNIVTRKIGKWAKIRAKIRSPVMKYIDVLNSQDPESRIWVLPIVFYVGTIEDRITDNLLMQYAYATKKLKLSDRELERVETLINDDNLKKYLEESLPKIRNDFTKDAIFNIALSSAAINMKPTDQQHKCLKEISNLLNVRFQEDDLEQKIKYLKK